MYKYTFTFFLLALWTISSAQVHPAITSWLQNTSQTGTYYIAGNSTAIDNVILVNCQKIEYSSDFVYVHTHGIPSYPTGPFLDGNPSIASDQNAIYKIPLHPVQNTGTPTTTNLGNIGIFINGVSLFDYKDGVGWNSNTNSLCGGPGNPPCPGGPMATNSWNRDAIPAERKGFDCSKAHPAMGNYHHHQNPSAFKLDINTVSTVCNLYDADGLYALDSTKHSPLIGFAYDGFPIYGAYGYTNADGSGGISRMKTSYQKRDITERTHHADGTDVPDGPAVSTTYPIGYFKEDYEFISHTDQSYLDEHNGRYGITPEYPNGTYAYFATVDENWNSTFPYVVGPTFYGITDNRKVTAVNEATNIYIATAVADVASPAPSISIFPNPASDLIAIQIHGKVNTAAQIQLIDLSGKIIQTKTIAAGSTIAYFDVQTVYAGVYIVMVQGQGFEVRKKVVIE